MATKGYTTIDDVQTQLGRTLTADQQTYLTDRVMPAAEEWVDTTGGRAYGEGVVVAEQLWMGGPYTWLSKTPVQSLTALRGWWWGQVASDMQTINPAYYSLVDGRTGYLWIPSWRDFEHLEADYTPDAAIPERIKLATAMLCGYFMRTVVHPETEWLTDYASGQDIRLKFRQMSVPETVIDLIGGADAGYVIA